MKVFGEGFVLCAHRASLFADVFRLGAFGRFQKVPPPKSFPFWRFLSVSRSASSRCFASAFSFAFLAFARDRCPAMVAASYGAKTWREDCSDPSVCVQCSFFVRKTEYKKLIQGYEHRIGSVKVESPLPIGQERYYFLATVPFGAIDKTARD